MRRRGAAVLLGALVCGGATLFTLTWLVVGDLEPGYSPRVEFISALAARTAPHPWWMISGFLGLALALGAFALLTWLVRGPVTVTVLVGVASIGTVAMGVVRQECSTALPACAGAVEHGPLWSATNVHGALTTLTLVCLVGALIVVAVEDWRRGHRSSAAASGGVAGGSLLLVGVWNAGAFGESGGAWQRILVTVLVGWACVLAVRAAAGVVRDQRLLVDLRGGGAIMDGCRLRPASTSAPATSRSSSSTAASSSPTLPGP